MAGGRFLLGASDAQMFELAPYILGVCEPGEPGVMIVEFRILNRSSGSLVLRKRL